MHPPDQNGLHVFSITCGAYFYSVVFGYGNSVEIPARIRSHGAVETVASVLLSLVIQPSTICMIRWPYDAFTSECVT
jgi:hypothetical protein